MKQEAPWINRDVSYSGEGQQRVGWISDAPVGTERSAQTPTLPPILSNRPRISVVIPAKNRAGSLPRCLDSVLAHIGHWIVVDTGSSDGTQSIVREHMRDVPGELFERPWRDFGWNRSEALRLARGKADYVLVMDADHVLHVPPTFSFDVLNADGYLVSHRYAGVDYGLPILLAPLDLMNVFLQMAIGRQDVLSPVQIEIEKEETKLQEKPAGGSDAFHDGVVGEVQ